MSRTLGHIPQIFSLPPANSRATSRGTRTGGQRHTPGTAARPTRPAGGLSSCGYLVTHRCRHAQLACHDGLPLHLTWRTAARPRTGMPWAPSRAFPRWSACGVPTASDAARPAAASACSSAMGRSAADTTAHRPAGAAPTSGHSGSAAATAPPRPRRAERGRTARSGRSGNPAGTATAGRGAQKPADMGVSGDRVTEMNPCAFFSCPLTIITMSPNTSYSPACEPGKKVRTWQLSLLPHLRPCRRTSASNERWG